MSRTYRRNKKDVFHRLWWSTEDEFNSYYEGGWCKWRTRTWIQEQAWYHSDSYDPSTPNVEFRRLYGHKHDRARTRTALRKELYSVEYGNVIFPKPRDIAWEWY